MCYFYEQLLKCMYVIFGGSDMICKGNIYDFNVCTNIYDLKRPLELYKLTLLIYKRNVNKVNPRYYYVYPIVHVELNSKAVTFSCQFKTI